MKTQNSKAMLLCLWQSWKNIYLIKRLKIMEYERLKEEINLFFSCSVTKTLKVTMSVTSLQLQLFCQIFGSRVIWRGHLGFLAVITIHFELRK